MKKGIITSTDSKCFESFQLFNFSLKKSNPKIPLLVYDLGLSKKEIKWCEKNKINIKKYKNPIVSKKYFMWQTWNKPHYIFLSPFKYTLWIDCDTIIYKDLSDIFSKIKKDIFLVKDYFGVDDLLRNNDKLYEKYPVESRLKVLPNGGVLGLCKTRKKDKKFLNNYLKITKKASKNKELANLLSWWDQGAIHWALEKSKNTDVVVQNRNFNDALYNTNYRPNSPKELFNELKTRSSTIVHLGGSPKPYFWFEKNIKDEPIKNKLKVFVLGHNDECLKSSPNYKFVEKINLNNLDNDVQAIAESRFFLSDHVFRCAENYIGVITHRYEQKYGLNIKDLKNLELRKDLVHTCSLTKKDWFDHSVEYHKEEIKKYIIEISKKFDMPIRRKKAMFSNNFICHKFVFFDFIIKFREIFNYMTSKYGFDFDYEVDANQNHRRAAYLYERIAMLYFSNRDDLKIVQTPFAGVSNV
jgi:hypothetical protein